MQIYLFVFDALPKPFDKHIVTPATLAVHTDLDTVILQQPGEFQAGELATLVSIEDIRLAMLFMASCIASIQKSVVRVLDNRHDSTRRLAQSITANR